MHIEHHRLSEIKPYASNPRLNDDAIADVTASIREFGWRQHAHAETADGLCFGAVGFVRHSRLDRPRILRKPHRL